MIKITNIKSSSGRPLSLTLLRVPGWRKCIGEMHPSLTRKQWKQPAMRGTWLTAVRGTWPACLVILIHQPQPCVCTTVLSTGYRLSIYTSHRSRLQMNSKPGGVSITDFFPPDSQGEVRHLLLEVRIAAAVQGRLKYFTKCLCCAVLRCQRKVPGGIGWNTLASACP